MPRLVTKFKYIRPGSGKSPGGYAKYIATRERVEKLDDSYKHDPATQAQKQLIEKILKDFPDMRDELEYETYTQAPTKGNASSFISHALEENAADLVDSKTYADYIATRPGAERFGSHGLFTDEGQAVHLSEVSQELNNYPGQVYTVILSLKREDAERLGFENGSRWRDFLRGHTETMSTQFKIPMDHLKWYAAFHNAAHHPHVHLMVYSSVPGEGHLSEQGVENIRSTLARDIFAQDLLCTYQRQTEYRDDLRRESRERIAQIVEEMNRGACDDPNIQAMLSQLAERLSKTSGKKVYGYLKPDVKRLVDEIVAGLARDERIQELYSLWYEQRENVLRTYTDTFPERIPLEQNPEFKPIRNAVVKEAMKIVQAEQMPSPPQQEAAQDGDAEPQPADPQPDFVDTDEDAPPSTPPDAPPDTAPEQQPTPAAPQSAPAQAFHFSAPMGATARLLRSLARMIQEKSDQEQARHQRVDRKQWQKLQEKKQAMGIRD